KGAPLGGVVFLFGEECAEFFAEGLPGAVLVAGGQGVGKDPQRDGAKTTEADEGQPLLPRGGVLLLLDVPQGADGSKDVSCHRFLAACELRRRQLATVEGVRDRRSFRDRGRRMLSSWWLCLRDGGLSGNEVKQGPLAASFHPYAGGT